MPWDTETNRSEAEILGKSANNGYVDVPWLSPYTEFTLCGYTDITHDMMMMMMTMNSIRPSAFAPDMRPYVYVEL